MKKSYPHIIIFAKTLNKIIIILFFLIFPTYKANSQQFNNWLFILNNGITFNTIPPTYLNGSVFNGSTYSCASISNNNGSLLFSSDGIKVYDKNNNQMPNGFGLMGDIGQINTALIVPFINDSTKYYLFTSRGLTNHIQGEESLYQYMYNIIDMQLNSGLGDVVSKNIPIKNFANEKMVAIPNANGTDIWWVCRDWTNHFYSYKITCQGFQNSNPIVSTVGNNVNSDVDIINGGDIKASPDGKFIAACYSSYFEIYKFDNAAGFLSNAIKIPSGGCYGIEFSPDSKLFYITELLSNYNTFEITQFKLNIYDSITILNSRVRVSSILQPDGFSVPGGLQLGPDKKIYHCENAAAIDVISNPNVQGIGCNFQDSILIMPNSNYRRFPYSYVNLVTAQNVQISYTVAADCRTVIFTGKTYIKGKNLTFKWKWGEPSPVAGTALDSATQVVASQGDTTYTIITHTYPPGIDTFYVNLTVTSDTVCGIGRAGVKVITKPPKPTANFGISNTTCDNLTVSFTDSSKLNSNPSLTHQYAYKLTTAPPAAYTNFSTIANNNFTFPTYDSFDVRLIVTSPLACVAKDTIVKQVVLQPKPTAVYSYTNTCGSKDANFTNASTIFVGTITQHRWFLNGTLINNTPSFNYSFSNYGTYTIQYVTQAATGCISDTAMQTVIIKDKPVATLTYNNNACANTNFTITANNTVTNATITNHKWLVNAVPQANTTNTLTLNTNAGTYTVQYLSTTNQGCNSDTIIKIIEVQSKPQINFTAQNGCVNDAITFTNNTANAIGNSLNYTWSINNNIETTNTNLTKTFTTGGNYNIQLKAITSNGCSDSTQKSIVIETIPIANFMYDSACLQKPILFTNTSTNTNGAITNYNWNFDNNQTATTPIASTTFTTERNYTVSLQVTTANGCSNTVTKIIPIQAVQITATNDTAIAQNQPLQLQASGASTYVWSPSFGLSNPSLPNPIATLQQYQQYQVQGTTTAGCVGYAIVKVQVYKEKGLYIPTIFTPNNDGINDVWKIVCSGVQQLNYIKVYNRWGQLVHQQNNCGTVWNGSYNGKQLPTGTYVYTYEAIDFTNTKIRGKGTVVVAR